MLHRSRAKTPLAAGSATRGRDATEGALDWQAIAAAAASGITVVVYMGIASVEALQGGLRTGLAAETPVAIVEHASLPTQRHAICRLDALADVVARERFASPAIIVVGDVVRAGVALAGAGDPPAEATRVA